MNMNQTVHSGKLRNMASVYLQQNGKFLLLFRQGNSIVSNLWIGSAGGHFHQKEMNDAKGCMLRELSEELSLTEDSLANLSLRYITLRYTDGEIRHNYYFFADLKDHFHITPESNEGITQWFSPDELSELPMPITARYVMEHYLQFGQFDSALYGGISNESGTIFHKL